MVYLYSSYRVVVSQTSEYNNVHVCCSFCSLVLMEKRRGGIRINREDWRHRSLWLNRCEHQILSLAQKSISLRFVVFFIAHHDFLLSVLSMIFKNSSLCTFSAGDYIGRRTYECSGLVGSW